MRKANPIDENNIDLKALKRGDTLAFEKVYKEYYRMIRKLIMTKGGSEENAKDVFQEMLIALVKNLQKDDFQIHSKLSSYLYGVASNIWLNQIKKENRISTVNINQVQEKDLKKEDRAKEIKENEEKKYELISLVLGKMSEECRKIIVESTIEKKHLIVLAEEMGLTYKFIRVKKNRCMNSLKALVEQELPNF